MIVEQIQELKLHMEQVLGLEPICIRLTQPDIDLLVEEVGGLITRVEYPKITINSVAYFMDIDVRATGNPISYMMGKPEDRRSPIRLFSLQTKEEIF